MSYQVALRDDMVERIREFADSYGLPISELVRVWIGQKVVEETYRQELRRQMFEQEFEQTKRPLIEQQPAPPKPKSKPLKIYVADPSTFTPHVDEE